MQKLVDIIAREEKRNPLTDDQIAEKMEISRSDVVRMRKRENIPDSRKRRLPYLLADMRKLLSADGALSDVELTRRLQDMGYDLSRYLVSELRKKENPSPPGMNLLEGLWLEETVQAAFAPIPWDSARQGMAIIGAEGSIARQVKQMKAALVYPPHGLHTLIVGETGTGKSLLVEACFKQAQEDGLVGKERRLIRFNCADYANNAQLLASQLFGHCKGAFTGAEEDKEGLVAKADGGALFLDEIHRLTPEGQEMLFSIIDYGVYRRLGESNSERKVDLMLIGATTEDIQPSLLATFKRRIPMLIELPALRNRGDEERYTLTVRFLQEEANRTRKTIQVDGESLAAFLSYDCPGNIGQLLSDVRVAVAKAYLHALEEGQEEISITTADLPGELREGQMGRRAKISGKLHATGIRLKPGMGQVDSIDEKKVLWNPSNIFSFIANKYNNLLAQGLPPGAARDLMAKEMEYRAGKMVKELRSRKWLDMDFLLESIMLHGGDLLRAALREIEKKTGPLSPEIRLCLCIHIRALLWRSHNKQPFINQEIEAISRAYPFEYSIALEAMQRVASEAGVALPGEAVAMAALYLEMNQPPQERPEENNIRILVVTHGNVARELAALANSILGQDIVDYLCIPLEKSKRQLTALALEKAETIAEENILLLVDIGTTLTLGELIASKTGKRTKTVGRVDTGIILEAAVKAKSQDCTLDEVYDFVKDKSLSVAQSPKLQKEKDKRILLTICFTGHGAAAGIKALLEQSVPELKSHQIEVIPVGIINENTDGYIHKLAEENELVAIVGSFQPDDLKSAFFSIESILDEDGVDRLRSHIRNTFAVEKQGNRNICQFMHKDVILCQQNFESKAEALAAIAARLYQGGYVAEAYALQMLQRENAISTSFVEGIAIPHTFGKYVHRSAVALVTLSQPLDWGGDYLCDMILMIALRDEDSKAIKSLHGFARKKELLASLRRCQSPEEALALLAGEM